MAIDYNRPPQVVSVTPTNYATGVPIGFSIVVEFSADMDVNYIYGNVKLMHVESGKYLQITTEYKDRKLTIVPAYPLVKSSTYELKIFGDTNAADNVASGVRSIFGVAMPGTFSSQFHTETSITLPAPVAVVPVDRTQIPAKPTLQWSAVGGARQYEIQLSKLANMVPILWPLTDQKLPSTVTSAMPNVDMPEGTYYWRLRTWNADSQPGEWSNVFSFTIDTTQEGTVTEEDEPRPEEYIPYDIYEGGTIEQVEVFPKTDASNQTVKVKTIYFRVLGTFTKDDISSFEVTGKHVLGEDVLSYEEALQINEDERPTDYSHEAVSGTYDAYPQGDGTTIIAFTPDVLS